MEKRTLKKIVVGASSESSHINPRRRYRVRIDGRWLEGCFTKKWFGWCFEGTGATGTQLNLIDQVYEIVVTPPKPGHKKRAGP